MKRNVLSKIIIFIAMVLMVTVEPMQVSAAHSGSKVSYKAIYGAPTIDGVVNGNEYGPAVSLNETTASVFKYYGADDTPAYPNLNYSFAWDEKNLYVGVQVLRSGAITNAQIQIDLSPEKKIADKESGMFFTFKILRVGSTVSITRHNYQQKNITKLCQSANSEVSEGVYHIEVAIPLEQLQVKGLGKDFTDLKMQAGEWAVGCYIVSGDGGYTNTVGPNNHQVFGVDLVNRESNSGGLGDNFYYDTLTLAPNPSDGDNSTGDNSTGDKKPAEGKTPAEDKTTENNLTEDTTKKDPTTEEVKKEESITTEDKTNQEEAKTVVIEEVETDNTILYVCIAIAAFNLIVTAVAAFLILRKK